MKFGRTRTLQSAKYLEQRRKKNIIAAIVLGICILSVIVLIIFILRMPFLQISSMEFSGISTLPAENLKEKTLETFKGDYLYVIPKSNRFFYSRNNIEELLLDSFKKIESLRIQSKGINSIEISVTERQPAAIVCDGFRDDAAEQDVLSKESETKDKNCFLADRDGYLYEMAASSSAAAHADMKYYINSGENPLSVGTEFLKKDAFIRFQNFAKDIKGAGIDVRGILISGDGSHELYIINRDKSAAVVYFDDRTPFDTVSSNFITFWKNAPDKSFDYINMRFGNNIFFTTKGNVGQETAPVKP